MKLRSIKWKSGSRSKTHAVRKEAWNILMHRIEGYYSPTVFWSEKWMIK